MKRILHVLLFSMILPVFTLWPQGALQQAPLPKVPGSALVLDLGTYGTAYTNGHGPGSVYWDVDSDGFSEQTSWMSPEDGFLAFDWNRNGIIDNSGELFGSQPFQKNVRNGFDQLRQLDSNQDGRMSSADKLYAGLKVWTDTRMDGICKANEIQTLAQAGITSINLAYKEVSRDRGARDCYGSAGRHIYSKWCVPDG